MLPSLRLLLEEAKIEAYIRDPPFMIALTKQRHLGLSNELPLNSRSNR